MLKQDGIRGLFAGGKSAASRRLCVETHSWTAPRPLLTSAASRRLCVETALPLVFKEEIAQFQPPLGGCVLKPHGLRDFFIAISQPPLGGCVLKQRP